MVHDIFSIKYCSNDVSGLFRSNLAFNLRCFMIYYVHAQAAKNKMTLNELIFLGCVKFLGITPCPPGDLYLSKLSTEVTKTVYHCL